MSGGYSSAVAAASNNSSSSSSSSAANLPATETIIKQCVQKLAQIVLRTRIPFSPKEDSADVPVNNKWFNVYLNDIHLVRNAIEYAFKNAASQSQSATQGSGPAPSPTPLSSSGHPNTDWLPSLLSLDIILSSKSLPPPSHRLLLERWTIHHERADSSSMSLSSGSSTQRKVEPPVMYKKMMILLRSIFSFVRLLPAFPLWKQAQNAFLRSEECTFALEWSLTYSPPTPSQSKTDGGSAANSLHLTSQTLTFTSASLSTPTPQSTFVSSSSLTFDTTPANFVFQPIQTTIGKMHVSVFYRKDANFDFTRVIKPTQVISANIIQDYIATPYTQAAQVNAQSNAISQPVPMAANKAFNAANGGAATVSGGGVALSLSTTPVPDERKSSLSLSLEPLRQQRQMQQQQQQHQIQPQAIGMQHIHMQHEPPSSQLLLSPQQQPQQQQQHYQYHAYEARTDNRHYSERRLSVPYGLSEDQQERMALTQQNSLASGQMQMRSSHSPKDPAALLAVGDEQYQPTIGTSQPRSIPQRAHFSHADSHPFTDSPSHSPNFATLNSHSHDSATPPNDPAAITYLQLQQQQQQFQMYAHSLPENTVYIQHQQPQPHTQMTHVYQNTAANPQQQQPPSGSVYHTAPTAADPSVMNVAAPGTATATAAAGSAGGPTGGGLYMSTSQSARSTRAISLPPPQLHFATRQFNTATAALGKPRSSSPHHQLYDGDESFIANANGTSNGSLKMSTRAVPQPQPQSQPQQQQQQGSSLNGSPRVALFQQPSAEFTSTSTAGPSALDRSPKASISTLPAHYMATAPISIPNANSAKPSPSTALSSTTSSPLQGSMNQAWNTPAFAGSTSHNSPTQQVNSLVKYTPSPTEVSGSGSYRSTRPLAVHAYGNTSLSPSLNAFGQTHANTAGGGMPQLALESAANGVALPAAKTPSALSQRATTPYTVEELFDLTGNFSDLDDAASIAATSSMVESDTDSTAALGAFMKSLQSAPQLQLFANDATNVNNAVNAAHDGNNSAAVSSSTNSDLKRVTLTALFEEIDKLNLKSSSIMHATQANNANATTNPNVRNRTPTSNLSRTGSAKNLQAQIQQQQLQQQQQQQQHYVMRHMIAHPNANANDVHDTSQPLGMGMNIGGPSGMPAGTPMLLQALSDLQQHQPAQQQMQQHTQAANYFLPHSYSASQAMTVLASFAPSASVAASASGAAAMQMQMRPGFHASFDSAAAEQAPNNAYLPHSYSQPAVSLQQAGGWPS